MTNPLDQILAPFRGVDIASSYNEFSSFIDFAIYLVIFTGLARFVLAKRFSGRDGRIISVGVGLVLSLSATVFSARTGFRLAGFGPLAAGMIILLVAVLCYGMLKHLGSNTSTSALISFIATYFLMRSVTPEYYNWVRQNQFAAWLDAALLLSIPILLVLLFQRVRPWFSGNMASLGGKASEGIEQPNDKKQQVSALENREELEKQSTKNEKQLRKNEKLILKDLSTIISVLKAGELTPEVRSKVNKALTDIRARDNSLSKELSRIRLISDKLERWEIDGFRKLSQKYNALGEEGRQKLKAAIQAEQQTIMKTRMISNIEKQVTQLHQRFIRHVNSAINELNHRNTRAALYFLTQAQELENESLILSKRLKQSQRDLLRLTHMEIGLVKNVAA